MRAYFVAGTDTEIGKTWCSAALLRSAQAAGFSSLGLKPVAAGAEFIDGQWQNEDAIALREASSVRLAYGRHNALCLKQAMAPHLAAQQSAVSIDTDSLLRELKRTMAESGADFCVVEGAGGWRVPLVDGFAMSELAKALALPVILVVGMRLGCLNHAQLSAEAIIRDGLHLAGWVANELEPKMSCLDENIQSLQQLLPAPMLARVAWGQQSLDINKVLEEQ